MKILNISAAHSKSGAGIAAETTHKALLEKGINSKLLFINYDNNSLSDQIYSYEISIFKKIKRKLYTFLDKNLLLIYPKRENEIFSISLFGLKHKNDLIFNWADIIHLHWINHGFIDISEINKWDKPVIWTIRDMWPFTGGCHYSFDCNKYITGCGKCDHLKSKLKNDLSFFMNKYKKNVFSKSNIKWVAVSSWLATKAISSNILKNNEISIIHSGIDSSNYFIVEKKIARLKFNFPIDRKILLIGATNINDKYKGFYFIKKIINEIKDNVLVVSFGNGKIEQNDFIHEVVNIGYIDNSKDLNLLYNSADIFIAPSICEAFGKTFAEAQSCGLPVLCFNNTGPMDIIEHYKTGYLAEYLSHIDLLKGYNYLMNNSLDKSYISERAKKLFSINYIIQNYIDLYKTVIDEKF
jgi:glycosyltransferase involved in cell wall biosynthesis